MSTDSLLEILGVLLGFYAILPRWKQLDLKLRIQRRDCAIIGLGLLSLLYCLFFPILSSVGFSPRLGLYRINVTPEHVILLVVIIIALALAVSRKYFVLDRRGLGTFLALVEEAREDESFAHLLSLVDTHLAAILKAAKLSPSLGLGSHRRPSAEDPATKLEVSQVGRSATSEGEVSIAARELLVRIFHARSTAGGLAKRSPNLAIRLLQIDLQGVHDLADSYIRELMKSRGSVWYLELQEGASDSLGRYDIEGGLLGFLLGDIRIASHLRIYKSIGDWVLKDLDRRVRLGNSDRYNWAIDDFDCEGRWASTVWTAIRFFDMMILEAIWQDHDSHMGVYYMPEFVARIVRNCRFDHDPLVDLRVTYPNIYCYLLSEIVSSMVKWVSQVKDVPSANQNITLNKRYDRHENGNPIKSAMFALSQSMRVLANEGRALPKNFRMDLFSKVTSCYFELKKEEKSRSYAEALAYLLSQGGPTPWNAQVKSRIAIAFRQAIDSSDIPRFGGEELRKFRSLFDGRRKITLPSRKRNSHQASGPKPGG